MTGVILCGGASTRMGQDKGLLVTGGLTWAQNAAHIFKALGLPFVCSIASRHKDLYGAMFPVHQLVMDDATIRVGGPLKGVLSVHRTVPQEDLLVLAVDLHSMRADVLETLLQAGVTTAAEAIVFRNEAQIEPLCGVYRATGVSKIYAMASSGILERHSMHHVLKLLSAQVLQAAPSQSESLTNYNTPDDLARL